MGEQFLDNNEKMNMSPAVRAALLAIDKNFSEEPVGESKQQIITALESTMMKALHGLPEELAKQTGSVDAEILDTRANQLIQELVSHQDPIERAKLQTELIYQYIALISRVQGSGEKAFTPELAREIGEMDCTLSAWSLKEKLKSSGVKDIGFQFGYPSGHAVGIVKLANGNILYVDAQNGFAAKIETKHVQDSEHQDTAYQIFEITNSKRLSGEIPNEGRVEMARPNGSSYIPKYLGIRKDGTLHTLGNMHMLTNPESPVYSTETAKHFREQLKNDPTEWKRFEQIVDRVADGKVIQETRFGEESS